MKGKIFDIKKFAIHDGPGIRSTLFLKGCPLDCIWCHNPEGLKNKINLWYFERKCIQCKTCVSVCPNYALSFGKNEDPFISINRQKCDNSGNCVDACPTNALAFDGYELGSKEVVKKLLEDKIFYDQSGGGITISGGDPLYQHDFSLEVLRKCREAGAHTAIETCMYAKQDILESFIGLVNLFIVDIKLMDNNEHKKNVGTNNELILLNFKFLVEKKQNILVRIPLIPKITATKKNIRAISQFVIKNSPGTPIELINFNPLAESKYWLMGKEYSFLKEMKPFSQVELDRFYSYMENEGVPLEQKNISY